jgi:hypothetical protein
MNETMFQFAKLPWRAMICAADDLPDDLRTSLDQKIAKNDNDDDDDDDDNKRTNNE